MSISHTEANQKAYATEEALNNPGDKMTLPLMLASFPLQPSQNWTDGHMNRVSMGTEAEAMNGPKLMASH